MKRRTVMSLLAVASLSAVSLMAADKPNFSGSWKLNSDKSDFGPTPAPTKLERTIKHEDPKMNIASVQTGPQGDVSTDITYTTDGKECVNKLMGQDVKMTAAWDGDKLAVKYKIDYQGMDVGIVEGWALSGDGKVLTISRNLSTPQGDFTATIVLDKQ